MNNYLKSALLLYILLIGLGIGLPHQSTYAEPNAPKNLQKNIQQISNALNDTKDQYGELAQEVMRLEKKLAEIATNSRKTELKIEATQQRIQDVNNKSLKLDRDLDVQKSALAEQLQAMYTAGGQSHLRLLLRQDDPSDIGRTLHYYDYLNRYRMKRIQNIHKTRTDVANLRQVASRERQKLDSLSTDLAQQQNELQATLDLREHKLTTMKKDIRTQERQLAKLQAEEMALVKKLDRITQLAEEKRAQTPVLTPTPEKRSIQSDKLAQTSPEAAKQVASAETVSYGQARPFSQLKGKLAWPTNGRILHAYRSRRNEKLNWSGVVIQASGGASVRSIASGKVAFSGWMDGYGHLIIIEHDNSYMSLYGYNRAVYKREGQRIKANEVIAAVGNSGGQPQNGLYFEIRKGVTPQNPAVWCR